MSLHRAMAATLVATALMLSACGSIEDQESADAADDTSSAGEPVEVTDYKGRTVELEAPAEDVVALEWADAENLVALGVMPAGVADVEGFAAWDAAVELDDAVTDVGTRQEPSVEAILGLEPDLVVSSGSRDLPVYDQLRKHVPVLILKGADASDSIGQMRENFLKVAKATGTEAEAEKVLDELRATTQDAKASVADAGKDGSEFVMADGWVDGGNVSIRMFAQGSLVSDLAESLGLRNAWPGQGDPEWGLDQTDIEGLTKVGEAEFFYSASTGESDVFADELATNEIWTSLAFVEQGRMHKLQPGTWTFGGPRSAISIIEQFERAFTG